MFPARIRSAASRIQQRTKIFTDRHRWLAPLIYMASVLYFLAQLVAALAFRPSYSLAHNTISDLGNTVCGPYGGGSVCSPRHVVMDGAFILLGVVMFVGSWLIYQEFAEPDFGRRTSAFVGFGLMAVGGVGAIFVGSFPENTVKAMHYTGAGLSIGLGNVAIGILAFSLPLSRLWRYSMLLFSSLSLVAIGLFVLNWDLGIGDGTVERIAAYPETVWLILFGFYMSRNHYSDHLVTPPKMEPSTAES
jgi:hypothetical membrane protein